MHSIDLQWRAIYLYEIYNWDVGLIERALGCNRRTFFRWLKKYREHGTLISTKKKIKNRWPDEVIQFVDEYVIENPV